MWRRRMGRGSRMPVPSTARRAACSKGGFGCLDGKSPCEASPRTLETVNPSLCCHTPRAVGVRALGRLSTQRAVDGKKSRWRYAHERPSVARRYPASIERIAWVGFELYTREHPLEPE